MQQILKIEKTKKHMSFKRLVGKTYKIMEATDTDHTITLILEEVIENTENNKENFFTKEQITEIIQKRKEGFSLYQLATEYHCSRTPIRRVLEENMTLDENKNLHNQSKRTSSFSKAKIAEIIKKRKEGSTYQKLSEEYGCTPQGIKYICDKEKREKDKK